MSPHSQQPYGEEIDEGSVISLTDVVKAMAGRWKLIAGGALAAGALAFGIASLIPPTFTARTSFLPPQQQQSAASVALNSLGSLGALAGLAGGAAGIKNPADQYVALMQSATVSDRIIDQYKLMELYEAKFRIDARKSLGQNVNISAGKKDGLITVEVDDHDPKRAAAMANSYVDSLRYMTSNLAVSEAQQRRLFFEQQLQQTKDKLTQAQIALQGSGFSQGALRAEPKAAAEEYARLKAGVAAADVKLQTLRGMLAGNAPEILQQQAALGALRAQLAQVEQKNADPSSTGDSSYVTKYREFKYQETLFDLFARQYELAKLDESREGALIQVVDPATPPERKSKPKRGIIALASALLMGLALNAWAVFVRHRETLRGN